MLKKKTSIRQKRENTCGWLLVSPMLVSIFVFIVAPTIFCLFVSFTDYKMLAAAGERVSKFTLANYKEVLTSETFWRSMWNTIYLLLGMPFTIIIGFLMAYALNSKFIKHGKTAYRVIYYLPSVSSAVAVALVWKWFFNTDGVMNAILGTKIAWLLDPKMVKNSMIIKGIWGGLGGTMLMYFAAMQNINEELYESATLDGANAFDKMFKITLPLLKTITTYNILMGISGGLNAFADNYTMVSGAASNTAVFWIFQQFRGGNYPLVSAAALVLTVICTVFSVPEYKRVIKDN